MQKFLLQIFRAYVNVYLHHQLWKLYIFFKMLSSISIKNRIMGQKVRMYLKIARKTERETVEIRMT